MNYIRVIPRDLFNEANLLKCYGRIFLNLESLKIWPRSRVQLTEPNGNDGFKVIQDIDGGLTIANVSLLVNGRMLALRRPLNARSEWPLYATRDDGEEIEVFQSDGQFTPAMIAQLTRP